MAFRDAVEARLANPASVDRDAFAWSPDDGLARFELDAERCAFAWACVAVAVDPMMYPHVIAVSGVDGRRGLTPAAYAALTGIDERSAIDLAYWLASDPAIVRFGLLACDERGFLPIAMPYRPSQRLVAHMLGDAGESLVGRLVAAVPGARYDDAQRAALSAIEHSIATGRLVIVEGPRGVGRRSAIAACAAGRGAMAIDAGRLGFEELDRAVRALCAEATLAGAIPVIADLDRLPAREQDRLLIAPLVARILDDVPGAVVVTSSAPGLDVPTSRSIDRVAMPLADVATRVWLWLDALGDRVVHPDVLRDVALRHKLGAGQIAEATRTAVAASADRPIEIADLVHGIRSTLADRFGSLVERLTVSDQWSDMVLSPETRDQLHALIARVRYAWTVFEDWRFPRQTARGGGVAALFSGPPGTGKTMVAGLIARELGRDLYRIDLSQIVSKWVGETEKQLGQVFDAAESGNALLLFDEADSLFARRTEVKSSSDRYANLEVNYLLQRIETFGGMTILTTNLDTSIDPALRRRLAAHVVFWPPEHDERVALWQRFLSTDAPLEGVIDHDDLATEYPDMTGANIRNAALAAAFLAAGENAGLSNERVHRAARAEYRAMGRVLGGRR
jgi:MoxR-like ATPase